MRAFGASTRARGRRRRILAGAAAAIIGLAGASTLAASAAAEASMKSYKPVRKSAHSLVFKVRGVEAERIVGAKARMRARRGSKHVLERRLSVSRVRSAASQKRLLRVRRPASARGGRLNLELVHPDPVAPASDACALVGIASCSVVKSDDGTSADPTSLWGGPISCADSSRHQSVDGFRRLTVVDGDDSWGERCELGLNNHREGDQGTFHVYREGDRAVTMMRVRLGDSFPLNTSEWTWQSIAQMKQAQPSDNGGGTPVLALHAAYGSWRLYQSTSSGPSSNTREVWSTPAEQGTWTQIAFDVTYSQDPAKGKIQLFIDANGDGDVADEGEISPVVSTYTLKRETATNPGDGVSDDGVAEGESIPSHLRMGIYHDTALECPPPAGCSVDYDDIAVASAG